MYELSDRNGITDHIPTGDTDQVIQDLHIEESAVSDAGKRVLKSLVNDYSDIFSRNDEDIGRTKLLKHDINTEDAAPIRQRPRRIPLRLRGSGRAEEQDAARRHN